jgi:transglutaminase-like putative cysteine protease
VLRDPQLGRTLATSSCTRDTTVSLMAGRQPRDRLAVGSAGRRPDPVTFWIVAQSERDHVDPAAPEYLAPTAYIDAEHPSVRTFAERAVGAAATDRERLSRLFTAVRDEIRYDPYRLSYAPQDYVASNVIAGDAAYCIPKAVVLAATARSLGIPARLGFSDVKNHLQSAKLAERMGTDVFMFHGYTELYVEGAWRKATPAFNVELCERFGVAPLTFDGSADALLHPFTADGSAYMEYIRDRGVYADLPLASILQVFAAAYPNFGAREAAVDDPAFSA